MKKIMKIYDTCKLPIRIAYFAFVLIAFGFLIQNESVNIFYTFKNSYILMLSEGCLALGSTIISNLPLIFMIYLVCKKANSGVPVILSLLGYFAYMITLTIFAPQGLSIYSYASTSGINTISSISGLSKSPLETGMIGSFIVAYITRYSYIRSRHRTSHSILGFLHKDVAAIIYNLVLCTFAGLIVVYLFPIVYTYLGSMVAYISKDLSDPYRLGYYGILDRLLSILGLGNFIRYPFWYTVLGGSYQSIAGQSILGDVNIWALTKDNIAAYQGAGRFITPYYVINMFMIPCLYLGILSSMSDKNEKRKHILPFMVAGLMSFVCGNPLPFELLMLFTSPMLLVFYLVMVGLVFAFMTSAHIFLGSNIVASASTITAMPGNFPDFIINLRSIIHFETLLRIIFVGLAAGLICFIAAYVYYHYLCYNVINSAKDYQTLDTVVAAMGGYDNVEDVGSGLFRVNFRLYNNENVSFEDLKDLGISTIKETRYGIAVEFGSSSYIIAKMVKGVLAELGR